MRIFLAYITDKMTDFWRRFKGLVVTALILLSAFAGASYLGDSEIDSLAPELKLKADASKILQSEIVTDMRCPKDDPANCVNKGEVMAYSYISDKEVPATTLAKGKETIEEDLSLRTDNALFYKITDLP